jgi:hypothetical protein
VRQTDNQDHGGRRIDGHPDGLNDGLEQDQNADDDVQVEILQGDEFERRAVEDLVHTPKTES